MGKKKNDRTVVGRAPAPGHNIHDQETVILKRRTAGPDETTATLVDGEAARAQKRKRAANGRADEERTWTFRGRESAAPRDLRDPELAGPVALPGPPPPAPSKKGTP